MVVIDFSPNGLASFTRVVALAAYALSMGGAAGIAEPFTLGGLCWMRPGGGVQ